MGTGEALNEHITGQPWPPAEQRLEMLEEAVHVIRELLSGRLITHRGKHYTVDTARMYSMPDLPPPVYCPGSARRRSGSPARHRRRVHLRAAERGLRAAVPGLRGGDRPVQGGLKVCWGSRPGAGPQDHAPALADRPDSREAAQLLPMPRHFGQLAELVLRGHDHRACGPDPGAHLDGDQRAFTAAGFDEVYVGQVGADQDGFFEFYAGQVLPRLRG